MFNKMRKLNQLYMYLMERESSDEMNIVLGSCNALECMVQEMVLLITIFRVSGNGIA